MIERRIRVFVMWSVEHTDGAHPDRARLASPCCGGRAEPAWLFATQAESRALAAALAAMCAGMTVSMLYFARRGERVLAGMRGRVLRLLPTRLEGAYGHVHPERVRSFETEAQHGVLRAQTDGRSVLLAYRLAEPQLQWCRAALSRALGLPG